MRRLRLLSLLAVLALAGSLLLAACGGDDDDAGAASTAETTASVCTKDALQTKTAGTLTVATDSPAFPPYVIDDDPTNGKGFESAVAYAIAEPLGFDQDDVKWTACRSTLVRAGPEEVRLRRQPGLDQPEAPAARRLLAPYYTTPQAVLTTGTPTRVHQPRRPEGRADRRADGHHEPGGRRRRSSRPPSTRASSTRPPTSSGRAQERPGGRDRRPTCRPSSTCLGRGGELQDRRPVLGARAATMGPVLEKDSPLTACVSPGAHTLTNSGELAAITDQWIGRRGARAGSRPVRRSPSSRRAPGRPRGGDRRQPPDVGRQSPPSRPPSSSTVLSSLIVIARLGRRPGAFFSWDDFKESFPDVLRASGWT